MNCLLSSLALEQAAGIFSIYQKTGVLPFGEHLHKPVFSIFRIEVERQPHQSGGGDYAEADTYPLVYTRHIHDDKDHEYRQQTTRKDEQVLCDKPLELHTLTNAFINSVLHFFYF